MRQGLDSGIWRSPHPLRPGIFWQDGRNVWWRDGGTQKMDGYTKAASLTATTTPIRGLGSLLDSASRKLAIGTKDTLYIWDESDMSIAGSGYTGTLTESTIKAATQWSIESWGNWFFATNGVDKPQVWKGIGASFTDVANMVVTSAELFVRAGPHLLAFNTSSSRGHFCWSDADNPETWTATTVNAAGSLNIRDIDSEIIAAVPMADRIAVYSQERMYLVSYLGSPFYFGYAPALAGIGALSKHAVVSIDRLNYGLSRQGFYMTDGSQFQWIDDPAIRTWFKARMNWSQRSKVCAYHDEDATQVIWYYPTTSTEPDEGLGYDYQRRNWSIYQHGRTAALERDVFPNPLLADSSGVIYKAHDGYDAAGATLTAYAESAPLDLGDQDAKKLILGIKVGVTGYAGKGVKVQLGSMETLEDSATYSATLTVSTGQSIIPCRISGRWIRVKISSSDMGSGWNVSTLDLYGETFGQRP